MLHNIFSKMVIQTFWVLPLLKFSSPVFAGNSYHLKSLCIFPTQGGWASPLLGRRDEAKNASVI